jgi:HAE1 family hydrophobic/amphiphilic exporter-1
MASDTQAIGLLVDEKIAALNLPPGVNVKTGGIFAQIAEGFQDIFLAMAVGIVLVYLVMVASLGSLRNPFIIVLSLPLAIVGALLALLITGRTLSISALMGFLLLIGVVVTNAIVMLTFVEQLRDSGYDLFEALVEGARVRLRPILMTAFTTTFALLPLAISGGTNSGIIGAELATVVIGGLVSSTFLTLIVVPVIYVIFHQSIPGVFRRARSRGRTELSSFESPITGQQPAPGDD